MENRKGIINYLLGVDVELFNTYHYVHELRRLLKENQIEKFNHKLLTYSNLTNGPLEGINNKIKLIKRVSFGYRNYDNLRNRIIITSRLFASTTKRVLNLLKR